MRDALYSWQNNLIWKFDLGKRNLTWKIWVEILNKIIVKFEDHFWLLFKFTWQEKKVFPICLILRTTKSYFNGKRLTLVNPKQIKGSRKGRWTAVPDAKKKNLVSASFSHQKRNRLKFCLPLSAYYSFPLLLRSILKRRPRWLLRRSQLKLRAAPKLSFL